MQGFLIAERGSTRLALAIGAVVVSLLAAAAVPLVFNQAHGAQETRAQTALAGLARAVETCRIGADSYRECDERPELRDVTAVRWGRGPGEAGLLDSRSGDRSFTAYAVSGSGARVYVWVNQDTHVSKHTCRHGSVQRLERDGCGGPGW